MQWTLPNCPKPPTPIKHDYRFALIHWNSKSESLRFWETPIKIKWAWQTKVEEELLKKKQPRETRVEEEAMRYQSRRRNEWESKRSERLFGVLWFLANWEVGIVWASRLLLIWNLFNIDFGCALFVSFMFKIMWGFFLSRDISCLFAWGFFMWIVFIVLFIAVQCLKSFSKAWY